MRRKYFAGNFSACIVSLTKVSVKNLFEASKVVDKPSNDINGHSLYTLNSY